MYILGIILSVIFSFPFLMFSQWSGESETLPLVQTFKWAKASLNYAQIGFVVIVSLIPLLNYLVFVIGALVLITMSLIRAYVTLSQIQVFKEKQ